jgi:nitroreductase
MSASLDRAELIALVDEARRAPSVHNIQPARWSLAGARGLALHADPERRLPVADPSGHDVRVSLGAACEGMALALARRGYVAGPVEMAAPASESDVASAAAAVAWLPFERGERPDALADAVFHRAAFRATFKTTDAATLDRLARQLEPAGHVLVCDRARIRELAKMADQASDELLGNPGYWPETWRWLRLSHSDPGWDRDGLNADALALSGIERVLGRVLMAPPAFESMRKIGLAGALISERSKIESAGALVLFTASAGEDPFATGRSFYRTWLEVTSCGLALCPISVLTDSKRTNAEIRRLFALAAQRRLVNVFRVGMAPEGFPKRLTPRLPAEELVLSSGA